MIHKAPWSVSISHHRFPCLLLVFSKSLINEDTKLLLWIFAIIPRCLKLDTNYPQDTLINTQIANHVFFLIVLLSTFPSISHGPQTTNMDTTTTYYEPTKHTQTLHHKPTRISIPYIPPSRPTHNLHINNNTPHIILLHSKCKFHHITHTNLKYP